MAGRADHEGLAPHRGHAVCPRRLWSPRLGEVGELADLVCLYLGPMFADLAPVGPEPFDQLVASAAAGDRGWLAIGEDRVFCRFNGIPPNRVTSGFLPCRSTVASMQVRGPCGVLMTALCVRAIFVTVERCLAANVLSIEVCMTQCNRWSLQTSPASR